ncbi:MAG: asparaginase, partial [Gemmatimonadetes bacterium]|nr:asparaginase [Gemmatimonadota bacterium]
MSELRVSLVRAGARESTHRVSGAVFHLGSADERAFGDATTSSFWRSSMKPFQALPVVRAGALADLDLGEDAVALACASHHARSEHTAVVSTMLAATGLDPDALICGPHRPVDEEAARALDA